MNKIKKIIAIIGIASTFITNCYAVTFDSDRLIVKDNDNYMYLKYIISQEEETNFLNNIDNEINIDDKKFVFQDKSVEGGNITQTKNIEKTKNIVTETNNKEDIINQLGLSENYSDNEGYKGQYLIDKDSISIKTNYNGYYEYLVEETKEYGNLEKNDLEYVPKQIKKDGTTLDLLNVTWNVENTKMIGENEVPDKYKAICYYATKKRVDYPYTYSITARYKGEATKIIEKPLEYTLIYKEEKIKENVVEPIQEKKNYLPIIASVGGATTFFVILILYTSKNTKIYNLQDGKWRLVGKIHLSKKGKINLDKFEHLAISNRYKIELNKKAINKVYGKVVEIYKENRVMKRLINSKDDIYSFEVNM